MKLASRPRNRPKVTDGAITSISDQIGILRARAKSTIARIGAEEAAVERHAAVPEREDLERVLGEARQIVEQHVADAPAEDDAERAHQTTKSSMSAGFIGEPAGPQSAGLRDQALGVPPAEEDPDDIGERVPADGERADRDQHRIDRREGQGEEHRPGTCAVSPDVVKAAQRRVCAATACGRRSRIPIVTWSDAIPEEPAA